MDIAHPLLSWTVGVEEMGVRFAGSVFCPVYSGIRPVEPHGEDRARFQCRDVDEAGGLPVGGSALLRFEAVDGLSQPIGMVEQASASILQGIR